MKAAALGLLDGFPEQEMRAAKVVESRIGAAVLVNQRAFEAQREDAGDGATILEGHTNLQVVAHAVDQVTKPAEWLGWQSLPPAR